MSAGWEIAHWFTFMACVAAWFWVCDCGALRTDPCGDKRAADCAEAAKQ